MDILGQKRGRLKAAQDRMRGLAPADRPPRYGKRLNEVKAGLLDALEAARARVAAPAVPAAAAIDVTRPGTRIKLGRRHPLTTTADELTDIMGRLGYAVVHGPEVEDLWHNYDALNIPPSHPARDPLDNYYLPGGLMLRSQTSTVQVRSMESRKPPIRVCTVGKVYRPDAVDATHMWMHHQLEGLWVESCRPVTMADLRTILRALLRGYLGPDTEVRLRPSYYPFVAPGVEIDALWNGRWLEVGGAGLVDPNVLRNVGLDPEEVSGCACGLGIDRLVMIKCGIDDIRLLYQNDTRILARLG